MKFILWTLPTSIQTFHSQFNLSSTALTTAQRHHQRIPLTRMLPSGEFTRIHHEFASNWKVSLLTSPKCLSYVTIPLAFNTDTHRAWRSIFTNIFLSEAKIKPGKAQGNFNKVRIYDLASMAGRHVSREMNSRNTIRATVINLDNLWYLRMSCLQTKGKCTWSLVYEEGSTAVAAAAQEMARREEKLHFSIVNRLATFAEILFHQVFIKNACCKQVS